ncbi:MAG: protein kinase [Planctomycetota bacterium]
MTRASASLVGRRLGDYRLDSRLGEGGMGTVYRATHVHMGLPFAVKVLHGSMAQDAAYIERFFLEARQGAALKHPNIVAVTHASLGLPDAADPADNKPAGSMQLPYLAMEFVDGNSLRATLATTGPFDALAIATVLRDVLRGLVHAHAAGVIHRDIKPDNLLADGTAVRIADFGLARVISAVDGPTKSGQVMGTPAFMPIEQWEGDTLDGRADLYALGITAWQLVTGELPFGGATGPEVLRKLIANARPRLIERLPGFDPTLAGLIDRLAARDRADRPASAAEALAEVETWLAGRTTDMELITRTIAAQRVVPTTKGADPAKRTAPPTPGSARTPLGSLHVAATFTTKTVWRLVAHAFHIAVFAAAVWFLTMLPASLVMIVGAASEAAANLVMATLVLGSAAAAAVVLLQARIDGTWRRARVRTVWRAIRLAAVAPVALTALAMVVLQACGVTFMTYASPAPWWACRWQTTVGVVAATHAILATTWRRLPVALLAAARRGPRAWPWISGALVTALIATTALAVRETAAAIWLPTEMNAEFEIGWLAGYADVAGEPVLVVSVFDGPTHVFTRAADGRLRPWTSGPPLDLPMGTTVQPIAGQPFLLGVPLADNLAPGRLWRLSRADNVGASQTQHGEWRLTPTLVLPWHVNGPTNAGMSSDARLLLCSTTDGYFLAELSEPGGGRITQQVELAVAYEARQACALTADGTRAATRGGPMQCTVWDVVRDDAGKLSCRPAHSLPADAQLVAVQFSPDGRWLVAADEAGATIWDLQEMTSGSPTRVCRLDARREAKGLAVDFRHWRIALSLNCGVIQWWTPARAGDPASIRQIAGLCSEAIVGLQGFAVSPDGTQLACFVQCIAIWDLPPADDD